MLNLWYYHIGQSYRLTFFLRKILSADLISIFHFSPTTQSSLDIRLLKIRIFLIAAIENEDLIFFF